MRERRPGTPQAVLFDLDDTLLDNSVSPLSVERACEWLDTAHGVDRTSTLRGQFPGWAQYWPEVEESCSLGRMDGHSVSLEARRRALREWWRPPSWPSSSASPSRARYRPGPGRSSTRCATSFAATFFLFFSFQIRPSILLDGIAPAAALAVLGIGGKLASGWIASRPLGVGPRGRMRAGSALVARGEFSM